MSFLDDLNSLWSRQPRTLLTHDFRHIFSRVRSSQIACKAELYSMFSNDSTLLSEEQRMQVYQAGWAQHPGNLASAEASAKNVVDEIKR